MNTNQTELVLEIVLNIRPQSGVAAIKPKYCRTAFQYTVTVMTEVLPIAFHHGTLQDDKDRVLDVGWSK